MWRERTKPYYHQLQTQQQMCQLRWKPPILYQNMPSMEKGKNLYYKTHQEHTLSRSPKNSWRLHKKAKGIPKSPKTTQNQSEKGENYQELISKLLQLGPQDWPKFIQEIKPILLKLSNNSTNPKPITEHNLEKKQNKSNKQERHSKPPSRNLFLKLFVQKPQSKIPK